MDGQMNGWMDEWMDGYIKKDNKTIKYLKLV